MSLPVDKALRKAQSHIKVGELAEAEELYKQILSKFPKNKKAIQEYQKLKVGITSKGLSSSEPPKEKVQELMDAIEQARLELGDKGVIGNGARFFDDASKTERISEYEKWLNKTKN